MSVNPKEWFSLLELAKALDSNGKIQISTVEFAKWIEQSQQTASRRLSTLQDMNWVTREVGKQNQVISITPEGWKVLEEVYVDLHSLFQPSEEEILIEGKLVSGWGDGRNYIQMEGYMNQFVEKLGYRPYPGTLNVQVNKQMDILSRKIIEQEPSVRIEGFREGDRTFGEVRCFPVTINGETGAMLNIRRTHHGKDIIELISPVHLRKKLQLEDGASIMVHYTKKNNKQQIQSREAEVS